MTTTFKHEDPGNTTYEAGTISASDFAQLDLSQVTVVDLRDENLRIAQGEIPGARNVPLSEIGRGLKGLPEDIPVYVICNSGDFSGEVPEVLADRGYEAYDVEGGFKAYRKAVEDAGYGAGVKGSAKEENGRTAQNLSLISNRSM